MVVQEVMVNGQTGAPAVALVVDNRSDSKFTVVVSTQEFKDESAAVVVLTLNGQTGDHAIRHVLVENK